MSARGRFDKVVDAILTLRGLGLEPTGFTIDYDLLKDLDPVTMNKIVNTNTKNSNGVVDVIEEMQKWDYEIMGIPIEPDYWNLRCIKIRKKEQHE